MVARSEGHGVRGPALPLLALQTEEGSHKPGTCASLEAGKGSSKSPLEPPEGTQPCLPLDPAQGDPCQPSNLRNRKVKQ